jgi:hypothetical protein
MALGALPRRTVDNGQSRARKKTPEVIARIQELMTHDTAGDPMTGLKWTRRTTDKIAAALASMGIEVSDRTVAKLLKKMGFSLRVNHKKLSGASPEDRDAQFMRIAELRERFAAQGLPIISIDSKKRELVGRFKNQGKSWERKPVEVNDHDFPSDASGVAIPYGVYDLHANLGTVFVGTTKDTPSFVVDCVEKWWRTEGRHRYPGAQQLAILADGGGSNASNSRVLKYGLQTRLCNHHGVNITVAHYPTGASKWNPIEHRLFSEISNTKTGLKVRAHLVRKPYEKGVKVTNSQMNQLNITRDESLPKWNYELQPN